MREVILHLDLDLTLNGDKLIGVNSEGDNVTTKRQYFQNIAILLSPKVLDQREIREKYCVELRRNIDNIYDYCVENKFTGLT